MLKSALFSRRSHARNRVDFRPNTDAKSPFAQLRRLEVYLSQGLPPADDITDCPDALDALREYTYRKVFTGTSHAEYVELDKSNPEAIDWLLAVHETEVAHFGSNKR